MNAAYDDIERETEQPSMAVMTAITKAELDQQITTARAFPRSIKRFTNECLDMATLSEEVAASCLYALPRGGKTIEGPSARMAEIIQSAWGNNRSGQRIVDEGEEFVTAQGIFHDLERNVMITVEVKRRITDKDGHRFNIDMIGVTGNAASSIAHRNAVLKGVPKAFWHGIYLAARKTAIGDIKSLSNKRAELLDWLQKRHVSQDMVLASLGLEGIEDIGLDEMATLVAAISSIKSGEATIEAAFAPRETRAPRAKPKTEAPKSKKKASPPKAAPKDAKAPADPNPLSEGSKAAVVTTDQATVIADKLREESVELSRFLGEWEIGAVAELPAAHFDEALKSIDELAGA